MQSFKNISQEYQEYHIIIIIIIKLFLDLLFELHFALIKHYYLSVCELFRNFVEILLHKL